MAVGNGAILKAYFEHSHPGHLAGEEHQHGQWASYGS